ncbi:MAG TPA: hypothetical protein VNF74_05920 [Terriglobales bacterium]|nr:hypothetical protein [Terriglobales bacterium]
MQWLPMAGLGVVLIGMGAARAWAQAPAPVLLAASASAAAAPAAASAGAVSAPAGPIRHSVPIRHEVEGAGGWFWESPRLFQAAQGMLFGAASFDYFQTARGMTSRSILHLTVVSTGLTRTVNMDFSARFAEGGWARFVGPHNVVGVIAVNAAADVLLALAARRLARQGPRWRTLATGVLVAQSLVHIGAGRSWVGLGGRIAAPYAQFNPVWQ